VIPVQVAVAIATRAPWKKIIVAGVLAFFLLIGSLLTLGMMMSSTITSLTGGGGSDLPVKPIGCTEILPGTTTVQKLGPTQTRNAAVIIARGKALQVPARGWVVAIATSMQESQLLNSASRANPDSLNYPHDVVFAGDHDSVGLFQQRDAWGTMAARMTPASSADMFYTGGAAGQRGLLDIAGWEKMSIAAAAQAVQVSAYPDAYAKWESLALKVVQQLGDAEFTGDCENIASGPWVNPLEGQPYRKTAGFGQCSGLWSHCHTGQDMAIAVGTPITAASAGKVIYAKWGGAYGNLIKIQHADNVQTWYAHQSRFAVAEGADVQPGDVIGYVGNTGNTTGPHLHFEVRLNDEPIDPVPFMAGKGANL
jgi:murein DD-endopeptidase MepM/ murein hydrolase activator NlpD